MLDLEDVSLLHLSSSGIGFDLYPVIAFGLNCSANIRLHCAVRR